MSKSTRIIKRFLALFLVVLLSCEGFAAAVSDNDGSAFITKAEFDSLKNVFQSQLDQYNTAIDNKIDGAIASYLAGITVDKKENLVSLLNKASKVKDVKFIAELLAPQTQIGGNAKYGSHIVFSRDSFYNTTDTWTSGRGGYLSWNNGAMGHHGYLKMKLNHVGGYYDYLKMTELDGTDAGRNMIFRMRKNASGKCYSTSKECFQIIPVTVITSYAIGGGISSHSLNVGPDLDTDINMTAEGDFYDYANGEVGMQVTTLKWHKYGMTSTYDPDVVKVVNATSFEESNITTTNGAMLDYLSGGKVDDAKTIYGTLIDNWNICYNSPLQTVDTIDYALQWTRFNDGNPDKHEFGTLSIGQKLQTGTQGSTLGIPDIKMWMKKYDEYKINTLYHDDWTTATGQEILYYNGMPLFTANRNEKIKIILSFTNSISSQEGTAYIRDSQFDNSDSLSSNVTLYSDKECTIPLTSLNIETGTTKQDKTFYINGKKDVTYWLKVKPTSSGTILVESTESFEAEYE